MLPPTDITEFQIPAGKVYLSPIIDCFGGMVVSWTIGTSPGAELVNNMLDAAIETVTETAINQWFTQTAEVNTAGLAGYRE